MNDDDPFIPWDPEFWDPVRARCAEIINAWFDEQFAEQIETEELS